MKKNILFLMVICSFNTIKTDPYVAFSDDKRNEGTKFACQYAGPFATTKLLGVLSDKILPQTIGKPLYDSAKRGQVLSSCTIMPSAISDAIPPSLLRCFINSNYNQIVAQSAIQHLVYIPVDIAVSLGIDKISTLPAMQSLAAHISEEKDRTFIKDQIITAISAGMLNYFSANAKGYDKKPTIFEAIAANIIHRYVSQYVSDVPKEMTMGLCFMGGSFVKNSIAGASTSTTSTI